jgi:hypothetical protein
MFRPDDKTKDGKVIIATPKAVLREIAQMRNQGYTSGVIKSGSNMKTVWNYLGVYSVREE